MSERERLLQIMEAEGMNAKQFSSEVGISQGTLSNIISGRNRPSLDVMQQVLNRFRNVQTDWLILGLGSMYRQNNENVQSSLFDNPEETSKTKEMPKPKEIKKDSQPEISHTDVCAADTIQKQVKRIIVFYTDGTYKER